VDLIQNQKFQNLPEETEFKTNFMQILRFGGEILIFFGKFFFNLDSDRLLRVCNGMRLDRLGRPDRGDARGDIAVPMLVFVFPPDSFKF